MLQVLIDPGNGVTIVFFTEASKAGDELSVTQTLWCLGQHSRKQFLFRNRSE